MGYTVLVYSDVQDAQKFAWTEPSRNAFRVGLGCLGACDLRHGARGADACCAMCVKWVSDMASPGTLLAPALSGQGTAAAAAHPDACFSKG